MNLPSQNIKPEIKPKNVTPKPLIKAKIRKNPEPIRKITEFYKISCAFYGKKQ